MAVGEVYQESGKFTAGGAALTTAMACLAGAVGGLVYGVVDQVNPLIILNVLGVVFVAMIVVAGAGMGANLGKVRNGTVVALASLIGGVVALWAAWVGFVWSITSWNLFLASDPVSLWAAIEYISAEGAWSIKGATPTGGMLWFIWGCEGLAIVGMAAVAGFAALDDSPFCEACGVWADTETNAVLQTPEDVEGLTTGMTSGDFTALAALPKGDDKAPTWIEAKVQACPRQGTPFYLSVVGKARTKNAKGEEEVQSFDLVKLLEVDAETAGIIKVGGAPTAAVEPPVDGPEPEPA